MSSNSEQWSMIGQWFFPVAHAAVITDATPISQVLQNILSFLLSVFGIVGIIGMLVTGVLYLNASGDEKQMQFAKRAFYASLTGTVVALGALVIVTQVGNIFS